jgi:serine-type D-Ala-D-Ala carboxypeptidase
MVGELRRSLLPVMGVAIGLGLHAGCGDSTSPGGTSARSGVGRHPVVFDPARLRAADSLLVRALERESFPGAVLVVGVGPQVVHRAAFGKVGWSDAAEPADAGRTLYDLASLTKAVATASAVWLLVEDGRMGLDDPVSRHLPGFAGGKETGVTLRQLLTHTAGVRAGAFPDSDDPAAVRRRLVELEPVLPPGRDVLYSDVGYVVLGEAVRHAAGEPLPAFLRRRVWEPLGMASTRFGVPRGCPGCAPTLRLEDGTPYRGGSYDETVRRLAGISGNAGLFSTADDLARFAAMLANGGELDGVRVFREETVRAMLDPAGGRGSFTPGWVTFCREPVEGNHRRCGEILAVGHTGSSGTALWLDPASGTWMVLLANPTYPPVRRGFGMHELRREVFGVVAG